MVSNHTTNAFFEQWKILTGWLSNTINGLSHDDLYRCIAPQKNHGVWILGHLIQSEDELGVYLGKSEHYLFPQYTALFGQGSALLPPESYPSIELLREQWKQVLVRNEHVFASMTDAEWDETHTQIDSGNSVDTDFFKTKGRCIAIWNIHQAYHLGQLGILRLNRPNAG